MRTLAIEGSNESRILNLYRENWLVVRYSRHRVNFNRLQGEYSKTDSIRYQRWNWVKGSAICVRSCWVTSRPCFPSVFHARNVTHYYIHSKLQVLIGRQRHTIYSCETATVNRTWQFKFTSSNSLTRTEGFNEHNSQHNGHRQNGMMSSQHRYAASMTLTVLSRTTVSSRRWVSIQ